MKKFLVFNNFNFVKLSYFLLIQDITVGNLNFHQTLIRSKSLKNSPLSNLVFENIIKEDGFNLYNRNKNLSYSITFENSYRRNASRENIYFTLQCRECSKSSYICQSLDTLFSFTEPKLKRLCGIYKNQQNYLSLIYNGCFFPILNVRNCHKCSLINSEDNIPKTNTFKNSPKGELKTPSPFTTSNVQVKTPVKSEFIISSSSTDFIPPKCENTCVSGFLTPKNISNRNSPIRQHDLGTDQLEQNVLENVTNQKYIPSYNVSKFSASEAAENCLLCSSKESNQIWDQYGVNLTFFPYVNSNIFSNCIRCLDSTSFNIPLIASDHNLIKEYYYMDNVQTATGNSINMDRVLANSNISGTDYIPHGKLESHLVNGRWLNEEPCSYYQVSSNCINNIYSSHTNPLIEEFESINEMSNSTVTNININIETTETDIPSNVLNQSLNNNLIYTNYEDGLGQSDYVANQIGLREFSPFPYNYSTTVYSNFDDSCSNQIVNGVNHFSGLDCEDCLRDLQNWKCSQSFRSYNNYPKDLGYLPSNINEPISYSNTWTPPVSEVKTQDIEIGYLHGKELDSVSGRKSLAQTQCVLLDENEKFKRVNSIGEKNGIYPNQHDKYSNISELRREHNFQPKHFVSKIEMPKNVESEFHSYSETGEKTASECDLISSYSNNFYTSNLQQCYMIYDPQASNPPGNVTYNTCYNKSKNKNSYACQTSSLPLNNLANPSGYDKSKSGGRASYKTTSGNFYKSNLSQYPIYDKEYKFSLHQSTYPRGGYLNKMDNNNYNIKPNSKSFNFARFGEAPKYYSNYSQRSRHISSNSFRSSLEFPKKSRKNNFQEKYRKLESSLYNPNQKFLSKTFPSKANLPQYNCKKDKYPNYSHHEYENKRGMFTYSQEEFFNAAANPNSYTY